MASMYILVQNSKEEVKVVLDQLPRYASDILDILKAEQAPFDLWLIIAREYFKQGKIEQFRQILEEGSSPEIDEYYADVRYDRIAILNALGAYYSYLGKIETKQREKEEHFKPGLADSAARARPAGPQPITTKSSTTLPTGIHGS
ncbi:protein CTR9 homolog [Rhododendron vialii]|uniref:protein CTR9 homolog n=1 Tax=Rhododendron vialii TaxID=182163 RepID=UPI00265F7FAD|nr:protein CTR9 homolog [Rhododendron vialii]